MVKVSVIVPVYNVQEYIRECILSLLNQTLNEIEIIIVNDGTPDHSIQVINDLIQSKENIILINKENGGLSSARNEGLKYATGEYISFVDSDDYINPTFLEKLYNVAKKNDLDIAFGGYTRLLTDNEKFEKLRTDMLFSNKVVEGTKFLHQQLSLNDYRMEVWDDLYKRKFLIENELMFINGILHEDEEFTPKALLKAKRVMLIDSYDYIYRERTNSIMTKKPTLKTIQSLQVILEKMLLLYEVEKTQTGKDSLTRLIYIMTHYLELNLTQSNLDNKAELFREVPIKRINKICLKSSQMSKVSKIKLLLWNLNPKLYSNLIMIINKI